MMRKYVFKTVIRQLRPDLSIQYYQNKCKNYTNGSENNNNKLYFCYINSHDDNINDININNDNSNALKKTIP